jgi:hypothetical protein|tara:strand:- start:844 stop:1020 length:177 start_codon:yes stop_codon:yes gene_type:complete
LLDNHLVITIYVNPVEALQSSKLSSVFPKKNSMAHSKGLSSETAIASATTLWVESALD